MISVRTNSNQTSVNLKDWPKARVLRSRKSCNRLQMVWKSTGKRERLALKPNLSSNCRSK